ncbi:prolyl oligopeptidase family serine peptidase [Parafilimonas sp.]|uniref:S9 family peptidase n=1 Tax=Parafilimonas sp. TaxID=1969739 RepID=UPI0039E2C037
MKKILPLLLLPFTSHAQLTAEQIMRDPKWIGTSPSQVFWGYDSKTIHFKWNPENNSSDSAYSYLPAKGKTEKESYLTAELAKDIANGKYNAARTKIVFIHNSDVYLLATATRNIIRITQTAGEESDPAVLKNDDIVYRLDDDLYKWNGLTGGTKQLTHFETGAAAPDNKTLPQQQQWLGDEALRTSAVLKSRQEKKEARKQFLDSNKEEKPLRTIYIGSKSLRQLVASTNGRFVTYVLFERNPEAKRTIVPNYVTDDGYTAGVPGGTKAGMPDGSYSFFVFDEEKDTVIKISTDSIPFLKYTPDYIKDYPGEAKDSANNKRKLRMESILWNDEGSLCIVDIFSLDQKDRWIMQLDAATGKLSLIDHQHDDAWIAGPGIAWLEPANMGWINNTSFYFQSEATGYSHLYTYNFNMHQRSAVTSGSYEIQKAVLSGDKKYFYIITNEEHPGKQNIYRININGRDKIKLTSRTGGYEMFLSPDNNYLAYRYSYQTKPWELYVQEIKPNAKPQQVTDKAMSDSFKLYPWRDTRIFTFAARDGATVYARVYEPGPGAKNNAAIIFVHGAGYLQNVDYWWSYYFREMMFNNLLADKGYTVLDIDYRASAGYGRNWRTGIYRYMGGKDLDDEVDAARYLVQHFGIDSTRIGMYGGSYGGFMTLMAMFTRPDIFKAGAALRPVTDWAHYNHEYTSAILNEPFTDSIAYARSSPINFASGLKNHLLICHGMVDMNVNFQDAVRLTQRLIELGKHNWQIAPYPVEDHGFVEPGSWADEYKRILKLFDETLLKK